MHLTSLPACGIVTCPLLDNSPVKTRCNTRSTASYTLQSGQTGTESTAYFVLEHQPSHCNAYPESGQMSFKDIYVEVSTTLCPRMTAIS